MPLASSWLYTCVLQYTRREGWAGREDRKMYAIPVFLCHTNLRARINTGLVLTVHWVLVYYILKSKAQHSNNPSAHCNCRTTLRGPSPGVEFFLLRREKKNRAATILSIRAQHFWKPPS